MCVSCAKLGKLFWKKAVNLQQCFNQSLSAGLALLLLHDTLEGCKLLNLFPLVIGDLLHLSVP